MFEISDAYLDAYKAPSRRVIGSVNCETDSGVISITPENDLVSFTIEKTAPKGKLFGFAISQKIIIEALGILDTIRKGNKLIPSIGLVGFEDEVISLPYFYVDTIEFNKVKNTTTITGYDILYKANSINVGKVPFSYPLYAAAYARQLIGHLGGYAIFEGIDYVMKTAPNLSGTETIHSALTSFAEFTGTICYVTDGNNVRFRSLSADFTDVILPDEYFDLSIGEVTHLTKVSYVAELDPDDNVSYGNDGNFSQVIWNNPYFVTRDTTSEVLNEIANKVIGLMSTDYKLEWRGCPAYELGDLVILQEKDGSAQYVLYLNETLEYNGGLKAASEWEAGESENAETPPTTISQTIKNTYAKVDKINQEIILAVETVEGYEERLSKVELNSTDVTITVEKKVNPVDEKLDSLTDTVNTLTKKVSQTMTSEELSIQIQEELNDGIDSVTTSTGFVFDANGLNISKTGTAVTTTITEDGMEVFNAGVSMLKADQSGVNANMLKANTYLIIGDTVKFEKYGGRMGCFWVGG